MFDPARSFHRPSLKAFMAAFDAAYMVSRGGDTLAAKEERLTIEPPPWRSMWGMAAIATRTSEKQRTRITFTEASELCRLNSLIMEIAAFIKLNTIRVSRCTATPTAPAAN